jgi:hypothetical protein
MGKMAIITVELVDESAIGEEVLSLGGPGAQLCMRLGLKR